MIPGFRYRRLLRLLLAMAMVLTVPLPAAAKKADPPGQLVNLQILAFNDYHGHLSPVRRDPSEPPPLAARNILRRTWRSCARATSTPSRWLQAT